jgi:hypothetical protein
MDRSLENYELDMARYGVESVLNFQKSVGGPKSRLRVTCLNVPVKGYDPMVLLGIVIGTNLNEEDMALANRLDLVKEVQDLLQFEGGRDEDRKAGDMN